MTIPTKERVGFELTTTQGIKFDPREFSHWHGMCTIMCLPFGVFFNKMVKWPVGFQRWRSPNYITLVYFEHQIQAKLGAYLSKNGKLIGALGNWTENYFFFFFFFFLERESQIFKVQLAHPHTILVRVTPSHPWQWKPLPFYLCWSVKPRWRT